MPDYSKGKIYCLRSHQTDDVYIGSTIQSLAKRKGAHISAYKGYLNGKYPFVTSFYIVKYDDCYIELIEEYACENKQQLERKEGEYIRSRYCVNKYIAGRTYKEYRADNKEKISEINAEYYANNKEKSAEYRADNKEKISKYATEYYANNKEKSAEYYANNKEKIAEYYANNKEKISEMNAEYYAKNIEILSEKITCECGSIVRKDGLTRHKKSKKHLNYLEISK